VSVKGREHLALDSGLSSLDQKTQRCAPGRADRFQTCLTGFDSSHRCCGMAALF